VLDEASSLIVSTDATNASPSSEPVRLHMPVDVRSVSLAVLAFLASVFAMQWAQEILVPILLGTMVSYALSPIVNRLERWRIPRSVGATVLVTSIAGSIVWGAWMLSDQANALIDSLPKVTQKIRDLSQSQRGSVSTIAKVQETAAALAAAAEIPSAAAPGTGASASSPASGAGRDSNGRPAKPVAATPSQPAPERAGIDLRSYVLSGTLGALAFLGKLAIVFFVSLFLLSSGNSFRRKMVKLAGPRLSQKKITVATLDEITDQIQRYLLVQLGVSLLVGAATWLVFMAIGLDQAAIWGVVATVTNFIPYLGAILIGGGSAIVALVQFGSIDTALLVGCSSFAIHSLIGNLLTPWWMGRASRMSPVVVFISVLLFGWLWGVAGLLLAVPILMVVKSVCDRVDDLKPLGELLGS
jgi:predicted PurR-regulated permease PerM